MMLQLKKDNILSSKANKQRFIKFLGVQLEQCGWQVIYVNADLLTITTAVNREGMKNTILVADDTFLVQKISGSITPFNMKQKPYPKEYQGPGILLLQE